jgi:hypothetical protein
VTAGRIRREQERDVGEQARVENFGLSWASIGLLLGYSFNPY